MRKHRDRILISLFLASFSVYCTLLALRSKFGYDDIMNLTFALETPARKLALGLVVPFTNVYRPVGSAVYILLYEVFGLNPLPFRILVCLLLLVNIFLLYKLARRLSVPAETAVMAALLYTFHGRLSGIYLNNGAIYDVLCGTFTLLTLLYYVSVRQSGSRMSASTWIRFLALFICALNAKEMAAIIPLLLLIYEWLYHRSLRGGLPAIVTGAITIVAARVKTSSGSALQGNPAYAMHFSLSQFLGHSAKLTNSLLYAQTHQLPIWGMLLLWAALIALAVYARRNYLWFFVWVAFLAPLPVIFIPYRGFFVMYLSLAGWSVVLATLLVSGRNWLWARFWNRPPLAPNPWEPERFFLFLFIAFLVAWVPRHDSSSELALRDPGQTIVRDTQQDILRLNLPMPAGAMVLFLHDRFPANVWGALMMTRLLYRDHTIWVDTPSRLDHAAVFSDYDRIFDYIDGKLTLVDSHDIHGPALLRPR